MTLTARRTRRPDLGKLVMVPTAIGFLLIDATTLGRGSGPRVLNWLSTALVCLFYLLIIWCYLRRSPARATSRSVSAHAAAVTAMLLPFVFPLLGATPPGVVRQWAGNVLVAAGTAWAVWSLRSLGRNVSVLAQARNLADAGPYRWVRHPLYTGEIVSSLGLAVLAGTAAALAVWLAFIALQAYRALREEQLLVRVLPAYRGYRERTAVLLPGVLRHRRHAERGAVAVVVAIMLPVLIGFGAMAITVGSWYLTQAQLQNAADAAALAGARDLPNSPSSATAAAQTLAADNVTGATVTPVTPYNGSSSEIQVTVSKPGSTWFVGIFGISAPTITATAVAESTQGTGNFIYAASTACNAISISTSGNLSTTTLWSNGGITATGKPVSVTGSVDVGNSSCPFPSQLTPPGATSVSANAGWPVVLPTTAQGNLPSTCSSASIVITSSTWLSSNPPGMYCTTGTITILNSGNMTFSGYEFVSENSSPYAIYVATSGQIAFTGYCPPSCSSGGTPQTLFYATAGGVYFANSGGGSLSGYIFAPNGQVSMDVSGNNETGFIEASTVSLTSSGTTSTTGTGPTPTGGVKLIG